ncbi:hypothetical protein L6164_029339 [Bauhinia variegata]|uniref:Uncharacterized protein n=1 Tax=Bauhinia variegata TaxID=167791 RepID=A0ACB9L976_BAUVA|nr:hypothetical protein L6164_029339 [Bauhinia variegata]
MPSRSASRRKAKRNASSKMKTLTKPNHHSSPNVQSQGKCDLRFRSCQEENGSVGKLKPTGQNYPFVAVEEKKRGYCLSRGAEQVSAGKNKMEGSFNGTLEETQKVESQSEQDKEVTVETGGEASVTENPESLIEPPKENDDENKELTDSVKVEEKEGVSESVVEPVESSTRDFTEQVEESVENPEGTDKVEFESKQEDVKDLPPQEDASGFSSTVEEVKELEDKDLPSSVEENELPAVVADENLRGTEPVEPTEVLEKTEETQAPPLEDDSSSSLTASDIVSKVTEETTLLKSDDTKTEAISKGTEETATDVKIEESSVVHETSKGNTNESSQPLANVPADETTSATVKDKNEIPRSIENPTIESVNESQHTGWRSCCGLLEVLRGGDR